MANSITKYECEYCKTIYDSDSEANECFTNHNIICLVEESYGDHDCWGSSTREWRIKTNLVFRNPTAVHTYMKEHHIDVSDYKIIFTNLV
jgi:hypothetical protein